MKVMYRDTPRRIIVVPAGASYQYWHYNPLNTKLIMDYRGMWKLVT
jgi:hypothetical protein